MFILDKRRDRVHAHIKRLASSVEHWQDALYLRPDELAVLSIPLEEDLDSFFYFEQLLPKLGKLDDTRSRSRAIDLMSSEARLECLLEYCSTIQRHRILDQAVRGGDVRDAIQLVVELLYSQTPKGHNSPVVDTSAELTDFIRDLRAWEVRRLNPCPNKPEHVDRMNVGAVVCFERILMSFRRWALASGRLPRPETLVWRRGTLVPKGLPTPLPRPTHGAKLTVPAQNTCSKGERKYWRVTKGAFTSVARQPGVVGIVIYGSLARHRIRLGLSDLCDGYVVIDDSLLYDGPRFTTLIETIITSCREIKDAGFPFHPYEYAFEHEWLNLSPPSLLCEWADGDNSTWMLFGQDIRPFAGSSASRVAAFRLRMIAMPVYCRSLIPLFDATLLSPTETVTLAHFLDRAAKLLPKWANITSDEWLSRRESRDHPPSCMRPKDLKLLRKIHEKRSCHPSAASQSRRLQWLARKVFVLSCHVSEWACRVIVDRYSWYLQPALLDLLGDRADQGQHS